MEKVDNVKLLLKMEFPSLSFLKQTDWHNEVPFDFLGLFGGFELCRVDWSFYTNQSSCEVRHGFIHNVSNVLAAGVQSDSDGDTAVFSHFCV